MIEESSQSAARTLLKLAGFGEMGSNSEGLEVRWGWLVWCRWRRLRRKRRKVRQKRLVLQRGLLLRWMMRLQVWLVLQRGLVLRRWVSEGALETSDSVEQEGL